MDPELEKRLRERIFADLDEMTRRTDGTVSREQLLKYEIDGERLPLIDQSKGIRNPRSLSTTLSVVSKPNGPYEDKEIAPGVWQYAFQEMDGKRIVLPSRRADRPDRDNLDQHFELFRASQLAR